MVGSLKDYFLREFGGIAAEVVDPPKVRIAAVRSAPSPEEFEAWRDHPVTLFVMAALRNAKRAQQEEWVLSSWNSGQADQRELDILTTRADAYEAIEEASYAGFCEWAGVDPVSPEAAR